MKEIDKKIKRYYEGKSLTKKQIASIVNAPKRSEDKSWKPLLKYVAICCIFLGCIFLYQNQFLHQENLQEKYAKEVAFNHFKNLESDILTPSVVELNTKMDKLNFEIHIPENVKNKYALLGGRYCSIDERMAAQLKLRERDTNRVVTLYVLDKLQDENFDESFLIDSASIQIWNEKSNLFVLASN